MTGLQKERADSQEGGARAAGTGGSNKAGLGGDRRVGGRWKKVDTADAPPVLIFHSCANFFLSHTV